MKQNNLWIARWIATRRVFYARVREYACVQARVHRGIIHGRNKWTMEMGAKWERNGSGKEGKVAFPFSSFPRYSSWVFRYLRKSRDTTTRVVGSGGSSETERAWRLNGNASKVPEERSRGHATRLASRLFRALHPAADAAPAPSRSDSARLGPRAPPAPRAPRSLRPSCTDSRKLAP